MVVLGVRVVLVGRVVMVRVVRGLAGPERVADVAVGAVVPMGVGPRAVSVGDGSVHAIKGG
jgi:hypothetical protein